MVISISTIESIIGQCFDILDRALASRGKRGAPDRDEILKQLDVLATGIDKRKRENFDRHEALAEEEALDDELRRIIRAMWEPGGPSRLAVLRKINTSRTAMNLVAKNRFVLSEKGLSERVSELITRERKDNPDPELQKWWDFRSELAFSRIPEIFIYTDPDTGEDVEVPMRRALRKDWTQMILQFDTIAAQLFAANEQLEVERMLEGDLPGPELWDRKQKREKLA